MKGRKRVLVLGATGSIGRSALDVIRNAPDRFEVAALTAHRDANGLAALAAEFGGVRTLLTGDASADTIADFIGSVDADIAVNGIAGAAGLEPSRICLESGKDLALANKETIVMAGPLIRTLAEARNRRLIPVDSEHSAVFSLINAHGSDAVESVILTASGGPFRTWSRERLSSVTPEDALKHPTWAMGAKITIDSATMANKGLEVIEACRLFDLPGERVRVVVHPESMVHSFIRTRDGELYAQLSKPDMRHPIAAALNWPQILPNHLEPFDPEALGTLHFEPPRREDFPLLGMAYRSAAMGGGYTIAFNAANEIAVAAFLERRISFIGIAETVARVLEKDWSAPIENFGAVAETDRRARSEASESIQGENSW